MLSERNTGTTVRLDLDPLRMTGQSRTHSFGKCESDLLATEIRQHRDLDLGHLARIDMCLRGTHRLIAAKGQQRNRNSPRLRRLELRSRRLGATPPDGLPARDIAFAQDFIPRHQLAGISEVNQVNPDVIHTAADHTQPFITNSIRHRLSTPEPSRTLTNRRSPSDLG